MFSFLCVLQLLYWQWYMAVIYLTVQKPAFWVEIGVYFFPIFIEVSTLFLSSVQLFYIPLQWLFSSCADSGFFWNLQELTVQPVLVASASQQQNSPRVTVCNCREPVQGGGPAFPGAGPSAAGAPLHPGLIRYCSPSGCEYMGNVLVSCSVLTGNESTRVYPQAYVWGDSWKTAIMGVDFTSFLLLLIDLFSLKKNNPTFHSSQHYVPAIQEAELTGSSLKYVSQKSNSFWL